MLAPSVKSKRWQGVSKGLDLDELDKLCREVWGAYEYLRDHDLVSQSGTSKRLRAKDIAKLRARLLEEVNELRGVVEGTHFHEGFEADIVLEGYEVLYWAFCTAIAQDLTYTQVEPAQQLWVGFTDSQLSRFQLLPHFTPLIDQISSPDKLAANLLANVANLVGRACAINLTNPVLLLKRDRAEMRQKEYLSQYWQ